MATMPPDRDSTMEWTAVSKKRRVRPTTGGPKTVNMESKEKDPCRKFVIELGEYRTRSSGPPSPEIPLGETKQEEWGERQRPRTRGLEPC